MNLAEALTGLLEFLVPHLRLSSGASRRDCHCVVVVASEVGPGASSDVVGGVGGRDNRDAAEWRVSMRLQ